MRTLKLTMILLVIGLAGCPRTSQLEEEIRQQDLTIERLMRATELLEPAPGEFLTMDDLDVLIEQVEDYAGRAKSLTDEIRQLTTERDSLQVEIRKLQAERQQLETERPPEQ